MPDDAARLMDETLDGATEELELGLNDDVVVVEVVVDDFLVEVVDVVEVVGGV